MMVRALACVDDKTKLKMEEKNNPDHSKQTKDESGLEFHAGYG